MVWPVPDVSACHPGGHQPVSAASSTKVPSIWTQHDCSPLPQARVSRSPATRETSRAASTCEHVCGRDPHDRQARRPATRRHDQAPLGHDLMRRPGARRERQGRCSQRREEVRVRAATPDLPHVDDDVFDVRRIGAIHTGHREHTAQPQPPVRMHVPIHPRSSPQGVRLSVEGAAGQRGRGRRQRHLPRGRPAASVGPTAPATAAAKSMLFGLRRLTRPRSPATTAAARVCAESARTRLVDLLVRPLAVGPDVALVIVPSAELSQVPWSSLHTAPTTVAPSAALWARAPPAARRRRTGSHWWPGPTCKAPQRRCKRWERCTRPRRSCCRRTARWRPRPPR